MNREDFVRRWRARRDELARLGAHVEGAKLCDEVLADFETVTAAEDEALLGLQEAAARSGYSSDHLRRLHRLCQPVARPPRYGSLGPPDRQEARRLVMEFIREIEKGKKINLAEPLTLEKLWDRYQQEASSYRGNLERTRKQKQTDVRLLIAGLGATKRVEHLTKNDVERYVAMRRTGHGWPDGRETKPVRARTIQGEIKQLRQMIYCAMSERLPDGSGLLENNPRRGGKVPKGEDPPRPGPEYDRVLKLW